MSPARRKTPSPLQAPARSPYQTYRVSPRARRSAGRGLRARPARLHAGVEPARRDIPATSAYLEFHKIRWPGGLKFWRVTGHRRRPRRQGPYDPRARPGSRAGEHARPLRRPARPHRRRPSHRPRGGDRRRRSTPSCSGTGGSRASTSSATIYRDAAGTTRRAPGDRLAATSRTHPPRAAHSTAGGLVGRQRRLLACGSSAQTAWTWERLWPLEDAVLGRRRRRALAIPRRGRCSRRRRASCCSRSRPTGSSSSPPARWPTTPSAGSRSIALTRSNSLRPARGQRRRRPGRAAAGGGHPRPARSPLPGCAPGGGGRARRLPARSHSG